MIDFTLPSCVISVSAFRCHERSYSLGFTVRFLREGHGMPEEQCFFLVLLKYISLKQDIREIVGHTNLTICPR